MSTSAAAVVGESKLYFGVEIEAIFPWLYDDNTEGPDDPRQRPQLRLKRPPDLGPGYTVFIHDSDECKDIVADMLRFGGFPVQDKEDMGVNYSTWRVIGDASVRQHEKLGYDGMQAIEITSPILEANTAGFEEIRVAMEFLRENFYMITNASTGLHVHVSRGLNHHFTQAELKYIASGVWVAEPALSQLYPPERLLNKYTRSIREVSPLALNEITYTAPSEDSFGTPEAEPLGHQPRTTLPKREDPNEGIHNFPPPTAPSRITKKRLPATHTDPWSDPGARHRWAKPWMYQGDRGFHVLYDFSVQEKKVLNDSWEGEQRIWQANSRMSIARLMSADCDFRPNWNFKAFQNGGEANQGGGLTIECRAAQGSVDPDWVSVWARIVTGIVRFCITAPVPQYVGVLNALRIAENADKTQDPRRTGKYDVIDMLYQMRLGEEARFVEEKMLPDRDAFWFSSCPLLESPSPPDRLDTPEWVPAPTAPVPKGPPGAEEGPSQFPSFESGFGSFSGSGFSQPSVPPPIASERRQSRPALINPDIYADVERLLQQNLDMDDPDSVESFKKAILRRP